MLSFRTRIEARECGQSTRAGATSVKLKLSPWVETLCICSGMRLIHKAAQLDADGEANRDEGGD